MTCKQARTKIVGARASDASALSITDHCSRCVACEAIRRDSAALSLALAQLRSQTSSLEPSQRVKNAVFAEMARPQSQAHAKQWTRRWIAGNIGACALILAIVFGVSVRPNKIAPVPPREDADGQFIAMPYVIQPAPYERTTIIRTEVPMQTMITAGFKVYGDTMDTSTPADVLYGADGRILAIRLISQPGS